MTPPEVEVEHEWFVELEVPDSPSPRQLAAIREAHAPYRELGIAALRKVLVAGSVVQLGPYWPPHVAAGERERLSGVGLSSSLVAR